MNDRRARVEAAVTEWTAQLVDLSGRNNLLYFRDLRQGTLDLSPGSGVEDAAVSELLAGAKVRLSQLVVADGLAAAAGRVRRIRAKANENFEERGLSTLMLGWGMATWTNPRSATVPAAPVVLRAVRVTARGGAAEDFDLQLDDEPEVNPTLLHLLEKEFAVQIDGDELVDLLEPLEPLPSSPAAPTGPAFPDAPRLFAALSAAASGVPGFAMGDRIVIGNFSYAKLPMVEDLERAVAALTAHDLIAAIAGDEGARAAVRARHRPIDLGAPDHINPASEFLVLDADASQTSVVDAALAQADLIVEGPPGTGKSQTIANLIATLVAHGRRVLFVAEKRAAIDAVLDRLRRVGLADLVLDLHDGAGSRRKLAQDLSKALADAATIPLPNLADAQRLLETRRETIARRTTALHELRAPWGESVYQLQAALLALPPGARVAFRLRGDALAKLTAEARQQACDDLVTFVGLGGVSLVGSDNPWGGALRTGAMATSERAQAALAATSTLAVTTLPAVVARLAAVLAETGLVAPTALDQALSMVALLQAVAATLTAFVPAVWDEPLDDHAAALAPAAKNLGVRLAARLFNGRYRGARRAMLLVSRSKPSSRQLLAGTAAAAAQRQAWLAHRMDAGGPRLPADLPGLAAALTQLHAEAQPLGAALGVSLLAMAPADLGDFLSALLADQPTLFKLPELQRLQATLAGAGFAPLLEELAARPLSAADAAAAFDYAWRASILEAVSVSDPRIGAFDAAVHQTAVDEFARADAGHISAAAQRVRRACAEVATRLRDERPDESDVIEHQARLKRKHMPVRDLFRAAPHVLGALKPCWAMSPLVVAQLLPSETCFDVVVFDEASQITPADAVPSLLRASRAIVAGDAKQLPPTSFFVAASRELAGSETSPEGDEPDTALTHDLESVLDVMAALMPPPSGTRRLAWHYRSRDERLIAFSNAQPTLYDFGLTTFPGVGAEPVIRHVLVGAAEGGGDADEVAGESSAGEVDAVVSLVLAHAVERPAESLGVIAMGITHAERIGDALRAVRVSRPELDTFFDEGAREPFFVKNLERVQGDERDAIILSVGYGKTADGRLLYRFGPINMEGGERRLNVAITRARSRMTVVSSFSSAEMDESRLRSEGAKMLRRYLAYAESSGADLGSVARSKPPPDGFEHDVVSRLRAAGLSVEAQYGASGRWIDVAVRHPSDPTRFVVAVETDGPGYASTPTVRDRDRLRREHLERLGWHQHRIWSSAWFRDPDGSVAKVVAAVNAALRPPDEVVTLALPDASAAPKRGPRPRSIENDKPIGDYTHNQLVAIVRWIESDTLLRTEDELLEAAMEELGFARRGPRIAEALTAAIADARGAR